MKKTHWNPVSNFTLRDGVSFFVLGVPFAGRSTATSPRVAVGFTPSPSRIF
jgi:hypothetical protein